MKRFTGTVRTGRGDFARWMELLAAQYAALAGVELVPGTLNVELDTPWAMPAHALRLEPDPLLGTVRVFVAPCRIAGLSAFVLRTQANEEGRGDHPRNLVEIAADVHLRSVLGLVDGGRVEVELPESHR